MHSILIQMVPHILVVSIIKNTVTNLLLESWHTTGTNAKSKIIDSLLYDAHINLKLALVCTIPK